MSELGVRIEVLPPLRVAAARGYGTAPEEMAWDRLRRWADKVGLLANWKGARFFGFNNPAPCEGSAEYGYEQWMTVDTNAIANGEVKIKDTPGGCYAVTRCRLAEIVETWRSFGAWLERTNTRLDDRNELEECLTPELFVPEMSAGAAEAIFDLYAPIKD